LLNENDGNGSAPVIHIAPIGSGLNLINTDIVVI